VSLPDGAPLIKFADPEGAFEAWKAWPTRGRPNEYVGMSYARLRERSLHWLCNDQHPDGKERLHDDAHFGTDPDFCETYGKTSLRVRRPPLRLTAPAPAGHAIIRSTPYVPSAEVTSDERPLLLTTGRTVYQFHTRTKTDRAPQLHAAAPSVWLEVSGTTRASSACARATWPA
jgi:anaerobic selenocysteine-containing dehydrogenase